MQQSRVSGKLLRFFGAPLHSLRKEARRLREATQATGAQAAALTALSGSNPSAAEATLPSERGASGIGHRLTKPNLPRSPEDRKSVQWTDFPGGGQVARMNRTTWDATVKRFHYDRHGRARTHLADSFAACNFARRLETRDGLTPHEYICKIWTSEPDLFLLEPIRQMPGLNK